MTGQVYYGLPITLTEMLSCFDFEADIYVFSLSTSSFLAINRHAEPHALLTLRNISAYKVDSFFKNLNNNFLRLWARQTLRWQLLF